MEILKLVLKSENLHETMMFYQKTLGFELLFQNKNELGFRVGFSELIFEKSIKGSSPSYHFALLIPPYSIEQAYQWLKERVQILNPESGPIVNFENWKAKSVYFMDNNGNILELISRDELYYEMKCNFSKQHIICINEIGLVSKNPLQTAQSLIKNSRLEFFSKAIMEPDFLVLGKDPGLLVISREERNWFPTQRAAKAYPIRFEIRNDDEAFRFEFN